ncbi:MAG: porin family protein [Cryomorphaceae bacterium]|jgi:opacity protein-like surface antigen|nr:porin family protein [Cryomorphaceae bacterium]
MKKLTLLLFLFSTTLSNAQVFESGSNHVSLGYGLGLGYGRLLNAYQAYDGYKFSGFGPVQLAYEHGITDNIGVGGSVGFSSYGGTWLQTNYNYKYSWKTLSIMVRGAYHFDVRNRDIDPYGGVGIGFMKYSYSWTSSDPNFNEANYNVSSASPLGYQIFVGARYHFTDNLGAYAELGYGLALFNAGLTFKL